MAEATIGIIGGSGLYKMAGLEDVKEVAINTPFGKPSDAFVIGELEGQRVAFLPRHGRGHRIMPSEIPFRANIYGMKMLGVERILSASAVGSLKEEHKPLDMVIPDQVIDRTRNRVSTFFGDGIVGHVAFADPICPQLATTVADAGEAVGGFEVHRGGTYVCMEGPAFSTKAESFLYRSWGADVIGMTNLQEAKLAREAEICYATIALATDYDCWHVSEESVTVEAVIKVLTANVEKAKTMIRRFAETAGPNRCTLCPVAARTSLMTRPDLIPAERRTTLEPILGAYLDSQQGRPS
jgi:5'-methylthioadenosine phosphorylase